MSSGKRWVDIAGAAVGLLLALPVLLVVPILIKLDDWGPVFFRQERIGRHNRPFRMWKFRTMRANGPRNGDLTVGVDPRITRVGRWLRDLKIDELPQLVHVLFGQMSLVGPRPEVAQYVRLYTPAQSKILDLVPGITSPASLRFWDEAAILARSPTPERTYISQVMPEKIRIHLEYAARASVMSDLRVILATLRQGWPRIRAKLGQQVLRFRRPLIVGTYLVLIALGYMLAMQLRFDFDVAPADWKLYWVTLPLLLVVRVLPDAHFGVFRGYWRHSGLEDLVALCKAATIGSVGFVLALLALGYLPGVPRSVLVLEWMATIFLGGGLRFLVRYVREIRSTRAHREGRRTLIIGTGDQADRLLREITLNRRSKHRVVGLVSSQPNGRGRSLRGMRVLGGIDDVVSLVTRHRVDFVIIALDRPSGEVMQRAVAACVDGKVEFKTVPSLNELLDGFSRLDQLRSVRIQDLLGRPPVELDFERVGPTIQGKVVLITGGAGSIGSELARQVARLRPARLLLLDQAESPLYFTVMELTEAYPGLEIVPLICDITDSRSVLRTMLQWCPNYVMHAAAYKHVPMMEDNVVEAIRNNVFGTMYVASAAASCGAERFVLISTDKAVRPSSVMGATKRVAERLVMGLPNLQRSGVDFRAVRFGNVLGSAGSVVPVFNRQIAEGKPITVTHPDVERYFMTIPEAAQLVLEAGAIDEASRRVTMLDMGEPVRILDLAERLIRLAGLEPHRDVPIRFIGLRPGEKLREELMTDSEATIATTVDKIRVVEGLENDGKGVARLLGMMAQVVAVGDATVAVNLLCDLVPECVAPLSGRRSGEHEHEHEPEPHIARDGALRVNAHLIPTEAQAV